MTVSGQKLPRRLKFAASALPPKAATAVPNRRIRFGPTAASRTATKLRRFNGQFCYASRSTRLNRCRVRWSISPLCCSGVLVGTNRILALVTASQIASASAIATTTTLSTCEIIRLEKATLVRLLHHLPESPGLCRLFSHPSFDSDSPSRSRLG